MRRSGRESPRAFLTAVVRCGPGAGLAGAAQARLCCLLAGAGEPATVLTNAVQQKRPHVPVLSTAIGRALARGHRDGSGAEGGGSGGLRATLTPQARWRLRTGRRTGVCSNAREL